MSETRKEFEERLLTEMLSKIKNEPLCNILLYASQFLIGEIPTIVRKIDIINSEILEEYSYKMEERVREVRY